MVAGGLVGRTILSDRKDCSGDPRQAGTLTVGGIPLNYTGYKGRQQAGLSLVRQFVPRPDHQVPESKPEGLPIHHAENNGLIVLLIDVSHVVVHIQIFLNTPL